MTKVGYGAMVLESLLAVLALCVAGAAASQDGTPASGTPFQIFSRGVAGFFEMFGIPVHFATVFMTMCVSALALTSLDAVARIGRMSFQELFAVDDMKTRSLGARFSAIRISQQLLRFFLALYSQNRICKHLAAVRFGKPAFERSRTYNTLRIYEGYGQKQQDALPADDNNALRYIYGTRSAPYSYGKGYKHSRSGYDSRRRDHLGQGVLKQRTSACHSCFAYSARSYNSYQLYEELC